MNNVLIVCGHPDLRNSVANKTVLEEAQRLVPGAVLDPVADLYPDGAIDVAAEQEKLLKADVVVLQYPLYWYGMPSVLQRWLEAVFQHGFSHGRTGDKLRGKKLVASFTMAAPESQCEAQGFTPDQLVDTQKRIARYAGMQWAGFVATGGIFHLPGGDDATLEQAKALGADHAARLARLVEAL